MSQQSFPALADFKIIVTVPVAWGDMDAFGHVNNTMYFRYFETARIKYFEEIGYLNAMNEQGIGPILAQTSCQFKRPVTYPDTLHVGLKTASIGNSSIVMEHVIMSEKQNAVVAIGQAVGVTVNYKTGQKVALPIQVKQAIEAVEGKSFA